MVGRVASSFIGDMDEVLVFNRALSAEEIALIAPPRPLPADGLLLSYDMETILPNGRLKDFSGQGYHGTLADTTDVSGIIGRARHFNTGEQITAPSISVPGTNFTVAGWFNWTTNPSPYYAGIHGGGFLRSPMIGVDGIG